VDADGEFVGEGEDDGLTEADGEVEADGERPSDWSPSLSIAWLQLKESTILRMSKLDPNLNDPAIPRSSKSETPPLNLFIS
jgi:hypothetical protein